MLTDTNVKAAKPAAKAFKLTDSLGMHLLITPAGGKLWRLSYRFDGKQKTLALGSYPEVSLAQARRYRDDARSLVANGQDPGELKKAAKLERVINSQKSEAEAERERLMQAGLTLPGSFRDVAEEWASKYLLDKSPQYRDKQIRRLEVEIYPHIGNTNIDTITAPVILQVVRKLEARGILETSRRVKILISQVMRYAVATGRAPYDPSPSLNGALVPKPKVKHHAAPTEAKDVAPLLRMMQDYEGSPVTRCALTLAPLLFVRPGELRTMEWAHVDLDAAEWRYTTGKTGQDHLVPLASQAVAALRELHQLTGNGKYTFPGARTASRPMSEATVNAAMRRMGIDTQNELTGHGFRAMARTMLEEVHGFRPEIIELQLAHAVKDPLGRAYNRTTHLAERKRMMQVWADFLDELRDNVIHVNFTRAA